MGHRESLQRGYVHGLSSFLSSMSEYKWLSDHEEEPWFCLSCELPFADSTLNSTGTTMADRRAPIGRGSANCQVLNARSSYCK